MTAAEPTRALAEGILLAARAGRFGMPPTPGGVSDLGEDKRDDLWCEDAAERDRRSQDWIERTFR